MSEIIASGILRAGTLQQYVDTFLPLVDECKMHFNDEGVQVTVVDSANAAMIGPTHLRAEGFESYEAPGSVTMGVDLQRLDERLGPSDPDDLVEYGIDMETRKLQLSYRNINHSVALIDTGSIRAEPDISDIEFNNEITIEGRDLKETIEHTAMVSQYFTIESQPSNEQAVITASGDVDDTTITLGREDTIDAKLTEREESMFSLSYLERLAKPIPKDAEVRIRFGDEFPIRWTWTAEDGAIDVQQTMAPRISTS